MHRKKKQRNLYPSNVHHVDNLEQSSIHVFSVREQLEWLIVVIGPLNELSHVIKCLYCKAYLSRTQAQ